MRLYETVIVLDPQLKTPEIEEYVKKFTNFITNHGGEIVLQDEWGKRRLAYEINRKQYGFYVLLRFNSPGQIIALLEREYKLNEMVIRYLTLAVDKKALRMEQRLEEKKEAEKRDKEEAASVQEQVPENAENPEVEAENQPESGVDAQEEPEPEPEEADSAIEEKKTDEA